MEGAHEVTSSGKTRKKENLSHKGIHLQGVGRKKTAKGRRNCFSRRTPANETSGDRGKPGVRKGGGSQKRVITVTLEPLKTNGILLIVRLLRIHSRKGRKKGGRGKQGGGTQGVNLAREEIFIKRPGLKQR